MQAWSITNISHSHYPLQPNAIVQGLLRHFYTGTSRPEGQRVLGDSSGAVPVGLPLVRLACGQLPMNRSRSSEA